MNAKTSEILEKVSQDRGKGDFSGALKRLREGIDKYPAEPAFYQEAMEIALESGETLAAIDFFKKAMRKLPGRAGRLWDFAADKVRILNDPILCKFLVDLAIKKRDLKSAETALAGLKDHTAVELLKRTQTKLQSLSSAMNNGFAFKGEVVAGALAEGLLCFRAKRFQHGVKAFLRILDEKPVEQEVLTPFFAHLEKKYPRQGGIHYVLGCCYLADEKYVKAFPKLCQGAALAPSLSEDAISRLEAVKGRPSVPQEELNLSLARLFIAKGDDFCAAERFGTVLEKNMSRAPVILEILKPFVQDGRESLVLDYVFMDAALLAKKPDAALLHMKKIGRDRRARNDLLGWMDKKSQEQALPVDILSYYAELTLDQGRFERAVEIFGEVVAESPADARAVAAALEPHRAEPAVQRFYADLGEMRPEVKPTTGGFEIEHYGGHEFTLDSHAPAPPRPDKETPPPPREAETGEADSGRGTPDEGPIVLGHTTDIPEDDSRPASPAPDTQRDADVSRPDPPVTPRPPVVPEPPVAPEPPAAPAPPVIPEPPVTPEPPVATESPAAPAPPVIPEPPVTPEPPVATESPAAPAPPATPERPVVPPPPPEPELDLGGVVEEDFDALFARFEAGKLGTGETLRLIERAMSLGRLEESRRLLTFTPENVGQEIKRKLHLAAYYLEKDQPLAALVILKAVQPTALSKTERRDYLLRIAYCYQRLNRFDAAHSVYLRIMSENPDFAEIENIAKLNYQKYIRQIGGAALVLEKVTTL